MHVWSRHVWTSALILVKCWQFNKTALRILYSVIMASLVHLLTPLMIYKCARQGMRDIVRTNCKALRNSLVSLKRTYCPTPPQTRDECMTPLQFSRALKLLSTWKLRLKNSRKLGIKLCNIATKIKDNNIYCNGCVI